MDDVISSVGIGTGASVDGLFAEFLERVSDAVFYYDRDGVLLYCNERGRERFPRIADLLTPGTHLRDILEATWDRAPAGRLRGSREDWLDHRLALHFNAESAWLTAVEDGEWIRVTRHRMPEGGILVVQSDETLARSAEMRAEQATGRLERFVDSIADGLAVFDADGRLVMTNRRMADLGPIDDLLVPGTHYMDINCAMIERGAVRIEPGKEEEWLAARLLAIENRDGDVEQYVHSDRVFSVDRYPTSDGGFVSIRRDITELRRAQASAQASEHALGAVLNAITDRVTLVAPDHGVIAANSASLATFGDDIIGNPLSHFLSPDRLRLREEALDRAGRTMEPATYEEFHEGRWHGVVVTPIANETGALTSFIFVSRDITDSKLASESIAAAKEEAERANEFKSEFLANMSHEFRTPLNAIMGFSDAMLEGIVGALEDARQREYLEIIHQSSQHLMSLTEDLLDISAIEAGRLSLVETLFEPAAPVHAAMALVLPAARAAGVTVGGPAMTSEVRIEADHLRIKQILVNLLHNAVKFAAGGHVAISGSVRVNGAFEYSIRDDGVGMSAEQIAEALTRFGRVGSGSRLSVSGTGLGLPLAKALTEAHGGVLDIQSVPGDGTVVTLRLPAERVQPAGGSRERSTRG